jgi:glycosyltransferase involved in cell wall biosynthesis/cephalosporin hydroxylase
LQEGNLRLRASGIGFSWVGDYEPSRALATPAHFRSVFINLGDHVRFALDELHRIHHFDLIEFADWGGLGFRAIQARRSGCALPDVRLMVKLHSSSQWMREGNGHWPVDEKDLMLDYCERYAFDHADIQASPSGYMLDYAASIGWQVRPEARVIANPAAGPEISAPSGPVEGVPELVFFGRLETRKGLELFLDAVERLPSNVPIAFLGRDNVLASKQNSLDFITRRLGNRPHRILHEMNRTQALAYLAGGHRLAVMPTLADNYPYTLLECILHGIPFVTSNVGGIPEIVVDEALRRRVCCEPTARDLLRCLNGYLNAPPAERRNWFDQARASLDPAAQNRRFAEEYERLVEEPQCGPLAPRAEVRSRTERTTLNEPLISVVVPYHNLPEYLPETLASLAAQTWKRLEVFIIDDGSDDPEAIRVFQSMRERYPQFRFLTQDNAGIGATRNRALFEAQGTFFLCMDADNIAHPEMIERFVRAMQHRPDCSALSCYYLAFTDSQALARGQFPYAYRPTGGPHVAAALHNVYGDANAIYRTADFRAVGGFETDRGTSYEDWEAFVKLVHAGKRVDVLPDHLFYYRFRQEGFSRITSDYRNRQRVLRQFRHAQHLPLAEQIALWQGLVGAHLHLHDFRACHLSLRYRLVDKLNSWLMSVPLVHRAASGLLRRARDVWRAWKGLPPVLRPTTAPSPDVPALEPLSPIDGLVQPPPESPLQYHLCVPGWFDYEDIYDTALRRAQDGAVFVEVGAYLGRSTIYLASRIKQLGKRIRFFVVDLWDGWFRADYEEQTPMRESRDVFWHFLRHVRAAKVDDVVIPLKMSSVMAARLFDPGSIDFVFLDADHSEKAVRDDLEAWYPLVKSGGLLGVHDYDNRDFPGVEVAVDQFLEREGLKGRPSRGVGVWFRKPAQSLASRDAQSSERSAHGAFHSAPKTPRGG